MFRVWGIKVLHMLPYKHTLILKTSNEADYVTSKGLQTYRAFAAGIIGGESVAAVAGGINAILWHDLSSGICQLQVCSFSSQNGSQAVQGLKSSICGSCLLLY